MPFFGPLKGRESRIPRSGDTQGARMSHAFFRTAQGGRMSHAFYRTAQGRLPKLTSSKGKTTFFLKIKRGVRHSFLSLFQNRVRLLSFTNNKKTITVFW